MKVTLELDEHLLRQAQEQTGIDEAAAVIHEGLRALIRRTAAKQIAAFGGATVEIHPPNGHAAPEPVKGRRKARRQPS